MVAALNFRTWRIPAGIYIGSVSQDPWQFFTNTFLYHYLTLCFSAVVIITISLTTMSNTCKLPSIRLLSLDLPIPGQDQYSSNTPATGQNPHYQTYAQSYEPYYQNLQGSYNAYAPMGPGPALGNLGATPSLVNLLFLTQTQSQGYDHVHERPITPYYHPVPQQAYSFQAAPPSRLPSSVASVSGVAHTEGDLEHKPAITLPSAPAPQAMATVTAPLQQHNQTPPTNHLSPSATASPQPASSSSLPQSPRDSAWKPRKKRQCPECHLFFSNLATHKSTRLKPTSRPHLCKLCHRGFARPNDLFRHFKCHWKEIGADKGQFRCPFKNNSSDATEDHCCHTLGIFSRCDTYKNHLKAIHFQYPSGTKKSQRNNVPGNCRLCQRQFATVDDWIANHIDTNDCPFASH